MSKAKGASGARDKERGNGRNRAPVQEAAPAELSGGEYDHMFAVQKANATKTQTEAMEAYQEESTDINNVLRQPGFNDPEYATIESATLNGKRLVGMADINELARDASLYRGVDAGELARLKAIGVGGSYTDKGFTSTAVHKGNAQDYVTEDGALVTIQAPKGTRGALSSNETQREIALQRGTTYKVVSISPKSVVLRVTSQPASTRSKPLKAAAAPKVSSRGLPVLGPKGKPKGYYGMSAMSESAERAYYTRQGMEYPY